MVKTVSPSDVAEEIVSEPPAIEERPVQNFTCERCGFHYTKQYDYIPFLCHRCMRYISKKVYTIMNTIQPATSTPIESRD